jgi:3-hydroxybutyryl-CoA dehydrogenase
MKNIAVIGAGTMGNGIAHTFAQFDYHVHLIDISEDSLERGMKTIVRNLDRMVSKEKISDVDKKKTLQHIKTFTSIQEGAKKAHLVIEAATENTALKTKIFKELDEICNKETILASNTSSISITEIAAATNRPDKVIGMHFMNPVPIMSLVEIIRGYNTSDEVMQTIATLSKKNKQNTGRGE